MPRPREDGSVRCECWSSDHWGSGPDIECKTCDGEGYIAHEDAWAAARKRFMANSKGSSQR